MSVSANQRKLIFPYLLIFGIFSISVAILDLGWSAIFHQRQHRAKLQLDDEAQHILGTMAYGSTINPYLTRIATALKYRLQKPLQEISPDSPDPHRSFLQDSFPEHEIWAFAYEKVRTTSPARPLFYPRHTAVSRRGMANAFTAIDLNQTTSGNDKLIDFLFGPGLSVKNLSLRRGVPTRVIFRNRHHLLLWDTVSLNNEKLGGFFILVPDSSALQRYAMTLSSQSASAGRFSLSKSADSRCFAGYLPIFPADFSAIYPVAMGKIPVMADFLRAAETLPELHELERNPLPWGEKTGDWKLYVQAIPYSSHLAFLFLPEVSAVPALPLMVSAGNLIYIGFTLVFLMGYFGGFSWPAIKLKTRFALLFMSLAAIPVSLFFIAASMYLEELRISLTREARQTLFNALSSFDQSVEEVYSAYRADLQRLRHEKWLISGMSASDCPTAEFLDRAAAFLQNLSTPLPWGMMLFLNPDGKMVQAFRTPYHQAALAGYAKFNRIGLIDAMRKSNGFSDLEVATSTPYISDADVAIKRAFETLVRLPVCHGFVNKSIGQPAQVAFGNFSMVRVFDYFPSALKPELGFAVAWFEEELDHYFCSQALKTLKREYPGSRFAVFRKESQSLKTIARTHRQADLMRNAFSASLKNGYSVSHSSRRKTLEVAFSSKRRPGIILAGEMDIGFIDKKLEALTHHFLAFSLLGFLAIFFFQRLLSARLIQPFLLLQNSLARVKNGILSKFPEVRRRDEIFRIFASFNEMLEGLKARQRLLSLVSGKALQIVRERPDLTAANSTRALPIIALVTDIRDFTTLCESFEPDVITRLLNMHFDRMSQIIHAHGGEVSRFVGDAIEATFPCPPEQQEEVCVRVVRAGLAMLQSMALINSERGRQGYFTYKIGIGMAFGRSHVFHVGNTGARTEILQIGAPIKRAVELEACSKEFPDCPLLLDKTIGEVLAKSADYRAFIKKHVIDSRAVYSFFELPSQENILAEVINCSPDEELRDSKLVARSAESLAAAKLAEQIQTDRNYFLPGLVLLLIPFILGLLGIINAYSRYQNDLIAAAHARNRFVLEREKVPSARKETVEMQLQNTVASLTENAGLPFAVQAPENKELWKRLIDKDLQTYGLITEEIIFAANPESGPAIKFNNTSEEYDGKTRSARLKDILDECLRCYGHQFDRFLQPDDLQLRFLGNAMSGVLLVRDARARFETVTIASETFWMYWQPVINLPAFRNLQAEIEKGRFALLSQQMKWYGRFKPEEYNQHIAGGILILCRPPLDVSLLRQKPENSSTLSAHIDVKSLAIAEERGDLTRLVAEAGAAVKNASMAETLMAMAYQSGRDESRWVIDKSLTHEGSPRLHIVATPSVPEDSVWLIFRFSGILGTVILMLLVMVSWYKATNEQGMALTVNRQILGSFAATMLLPVAGLFMVLTLLVGDWQTNLLKNSEAEFLHQVDLIEQKVRFHHFANPLKVRKILEAGGINNLIAVTLPENQDSPEFKTAQSRLLKFLGKAHKGVLSRSQALGVNSIMVDSSNGLSEFLAIDGSFSLQNDPMKKAFSFHAARILNRLAPERKKTGQKTDTNQLLVDEMTTQLVFEVLDSTFGPDASLEILFGQGKGVELFSSISNDIFFQDCFPSLANPLATTFVVFMHLQSNQFAMARIMAARHFQQIESDPLEFKVFAASRLSPGMPLVPETGEAMPFIRDVARQSMLVGPLEKSLVYNGEEYRVITQPSIVMPQFIYVGVARASQFAAQVRSRILRFVVILSLFFFLLFLLSMHTAQDITEPLTLLLARFHQVKKGNYDCQLSFARNDELEMIAVEFNGMVRQLSEKDLLAKMVSESAVEMAHSDQAESEAMKGQKRRAAVSYFGVTDYEKFLKKENLHGVKIKLGKWVEHVCTVVTAHGGEINKIMEGKILAVFFAEPEKALKTDNEAITSHIDKAFSAAMQLCNDNESEVPATSCGIHEGEVISGLMGNLDRRDFTIIGDPVNMAARCFMLSEKLFESCGVVASAETTSLLGDSYKKTDLGRHRIKGKHLPIKLFKVYV